MKKFLRILIFIAVMSLSSLSLADSDSGFIVVAKDNEMVYFQDAKPEVIEGRTFVPVRSLAESMGIDVEWKAIERVVSLSKEDKWGNISIDESKMSFSDGTEIASQSYIKDGRTMVQFRAIAEQFGYSVSYIPEGPIARFIEDESEIEIVDDNALYEKLKPEIDVEYRIYLEEKAAREEAERKLREEEERRAEEAKYKTVYFTFDDGPNIYTPRILDILKQYDMKATFFLLDGNMRRYPAYTKRIIDEGHSVGLHGVSHNKNLLYGSNPYSVVNEMYTQNSNLKSGFGIMTDLVRVPYGSKPLMKSSQFWKLKEAGFRVWDWHIDSLDYTSSSSQIYRNVVPEIRLKVNGGIKPVVLFHDKDQTARALPDILGYLVQNGYKSRGIDPYARNYNWWER